LLERNAVVLNGFHISKSVDLQIKVKKQEKVRSIEEQSRHVTKMVMISGRCKFTVYEHIP